MLRAAKKASWLFALLVIVPVGCSDDAAVPADSGIKDAKTQDSQTQDSQAKDSQAQDSQAQDSRAQDQLADGSSCAAPKLTWTTDGGLVAARDKSELTDCSIFKLTREDLGSGTTTSCTTTVEPQNTLLAGIMTAVAGADVQQALGSGVAIYGIDTRPLDGHVFKITVGSQSVLIGGQCNGASGCVDIPAGLATLLDTLLALTAEQRAKCSALP